jgi:hypothetical protein
MANGVRVRVWKLTPIWRMRQISENDDHRSLPLGLREALVIELLPTGLLTGLLSGHSAASIALAAAVGVSVYITTEASCR